MRTLVFSSSPSVLTEEIALLEVAWTEAAAGHEVVYLRCTGALLNCPANPGHDLGICARCVQQSEHTTRNLLPPGTDVIELPPPAEAGDDPRFATLADAAAFEVDGAVLGHFLVSALLDETRDIHDELTDAESGRLATLARNATHLYRSVLGILGSHGIDRVAVRVPRRDSDGPVITAAEARGLDTWVFHPARTADDLRVAIFRGTTIYSADRFAETLRSIPAPSDAADDPVGAAGRAWFDALDQGGTPPGLKPIFAFPTEGEWRPWRHRDDRRLLAIFPSSEWEFMQSKLAVAISRLGIEGILGVRTQYDVLEEILGNPSIADAVDIVVRWHPHLSSAGPNERARLDGLVATAPPHVHHVLPEQSTQSRAIIRAADIVMTFGSTLTADALWMGRRVVVFERTGMEALSTIDTVGTVDELERLLRADPGPPDPVSARSDALRLAYALNGLQLPAPTHLGIGAHGWELTSRGIPVKAPRRNEPDSVLRRLVARLRGE